MKNHQSPHAHSFDKPDRQTKHLTVIKAPDVMTAMGLVILINDESSNVRQCEENGNAAIRDSFFP